MKALRWFVAAVREHWVVAIAASVIGYSLGWWLA